MSRKMITDGGVDIPAMWRLDLTRGTSLGTHDGLSHSQQQYWLEKRCEGRVFSGPPSKAHLKYSVTGSTSFVLVAVESGLDIEPEWTLCSSIYKKTTGPVLMGLMR